MPGGDEEGPAGAPCRTPARSQEEAAWVPGVWQPQGLPPAL